MIVKFSYEGVFLPPQVKTEGAAGLDLFNNSDHTFVFEKKGDSYIIPTGVKMEIPEGFVGLLMVRSSIGFKYDCTLSNAVGVIDSDYRGEVKGKLTCLKDQENPIKIEPGDRFCQLLIVPCPKVKYTKVEKLSETERGENGFGSTGK